MSEQGDDLIIKKVLYAGSAPANFTDGTKVHFHFQCRICNKDKTLLDDSRKLGEGKPIELVLGKKFKLEVWEAIVQRMALNEVAEFTIDKNLVLQYPFVSKALRDAQKPKEERKAHCCGMTLQSEGVGYGDLNNYLKHPQNLEFTIELLKVENPESYEKETWQLSDKERLELIPELKEKGNQLYKLKNYKSAADSYAKALGIIEQLMIKEKPHGEDWNKLNEQKVPLLLNFSQCVLNQGDYYSTIEHCTTVLGIDRDNIKAYFRRAKAHVGAWNPDCARRDFLKVIDLDSTLEASVRKELNILDDMVKQKDIQDKQKLKNLFI